MKKSLDGDQAMSAVLKYLLQILGLAFFYGILLYTTLHVWVPIFNGAFSKVSYTMFKENNIPTLLAIYVLFSYFANNFMLKLYEQGKTKQLLFSLLADLLVLALGILLSLLYNNNAIKSRVGSIDDTYNIYIIMALLIAKEFIAAWILSKQEPVKPVKSR
jgi:hypothetical protein